MRPAHWRAWTLRELAILRDLYTRGCHVTAIAELLRRTPSAVYTIARERRVRRRRRGPYRWRSGEVPASRRARHGRQWGARRSPQHPGGQL